MSLVWLGAFQVITDSNLDTKPRQMRDEWAFETEFNHCGNLGTQLVSTEPGALIGLLRVEDTRASGACQNNVLFALETIDGWVHQHIELWREDGGRHNSLVSHT